MINAEKYNTLHNAYLNAFNCNSNACQGDQIFYISLIIICFIIFIILLILAQYCLLKVLSQNNTNYSDDNIVEDIIEDIDHESN
jgi:hypothetical protein